MKELIYLIGFMGSGKSTVGKKLSSHLSYSFIDLDSMIEKKYKITIPDIFSRFDEAAFRKVEHETLKQTFGLKKHVIATGGGTPCFYNNMELINTAGYSVYLELPPKSLHYRLLNSKKTRPLLAQNPPEKVLEYIEEQLWKRDYFYRQANYTINGEDIQAEELAEFLKAM